MLPPELWSIVCHFLDKKDLVRVACTSSQLSTAARSVLYRSINLHSNKDGLQATFDLIKSDISLARKVIEIQIFTERWTEGEETTWLDLTAFSNLAQLQSMMMTGSPFGTAVEQDTFLEIVAKSCPLLKEFRYRRGRYPSPQFFFNRHPNNFPSDNFKICGLGKLIWDDDGTLF